MIDQDSNDETTEFSIGPETTQAELSLITGKVCWIIRQIGYGHEFRNMYMRSSNPVISEAGRLDSGLIYLYVEGVGYVYFDRGEVVVWND